MLYKSLSDGILATLGVWESRGRSNNVLLTFCRRVQCWNVLQCLWTSTSQQFCSWSTWNVLRSGMAQHAALFCTKCSKCSKAQLNAELFCTTAFPSSSLVTAMYVQWLEKPSHPYMVAASLRRIHFKCSHFTVSVYRRHSLGTLVQSVLRTRQTQYQLSNVKCICCQCSESINSIHILCTQTLNSTQLLDNVCAHDLLTISTGVAG